jgi:type I restriction enzyme S subunit
MVLADNLKKAVLQAAIQGKLTEQLETDSTAKDLVNSIRTKKNELIQNKKIKKEIQLSDISGDDLEFTLPFNWSYERMGKIFEIIRGSSPRPKGSPEYWTIELKEYHWITISDITNYCVDGVLIKTREFLTEKGKEKSTFVQKGELVIAVSGSTTGKSCLLGIDGYIYDGLAAIIDCTNSFNKKFLWIYMQYFYDKLNASKRGSAFPNINTDLLKETIIMIPPIEEQKRIVDKVSEIMFKIDEYEKVENDLEFIRKAFSGDIEKSILQAAMQGQLTEQLKSDSNVNDIISEISNFHKKNVKEVENESEFIFPENWKCVKLADATALYTGNSISENIKKSKYMNLKKGYNYIGTKDVGFDHIINYENGVKIPFDEPKFKYADKDATLLCIEGGSAGKKIAILDEKVCFGNKLCAFHPIGIDKKYLYYFLQSPVFLSIFMDKMSGMIGGVSINKIKQVIIPLPPIEEQKRIVEKLEKLLILCTELKE